MNEDIIAAIEEYYPKNISSFDAKYDSTDQCVALSELKRQFDVRWSTFIDRMISNFGSEYVVDRSDNEPGNRCVIYLYRGDLLFEVVVHISRILPYFFYSAKKLLVNMAQIRTTKVQSINNGAFSEILDEVENTVKAIKAIYNYQIMPVELAHTLVPHISTKNKGLQEATIFHAVFADTDI
jgi:hypothetical protein